MKKYLPIIAIIIIDIFAISYYAFGMTFNGTPYELQQLRGEQMLGATYIFPYDGGTGTSTSPTYGDILVGNAGGTYTLTATSTLFAGASLWQQNGSDIYYNSGDVGIGTTSPNHTLDVNGNIGLKESQYINWGYTDGESGYGFKDNSGTLQYKSSGGSWADIGSGGGGGSDVNWTFFNGSGIRVSTSTNQVLVGGTATSTSAFLEVNSPGGTDPFFIGSSSPYLVVKESGRIGIATSSPSENLDIYNDTATSTGYIYSGGSELGGEIVLEDTDGAGCSKQYTLDGLLYIDTITCP